MHHKQADIKPEVSTVKIKIYKTGKKYYSNKTDKNDFKNMAWLHNNEECRCL